MGFPGSSVVKNPPTNAFDVRLILRLEGSPGRENGNPLVAGTIPWTRSLAGYSLWGHRELDMTEQLGTSTRRLIEENQSHGAMLAGREDFKATC